MEIVTTKKQLNDLCKTLSADTFIAVDTEFIRDRTYWPELCLIQVAGKDVAAAIDPLANELDLTPLYKILEDKKITKIFHSGRHDIEIFYCIYKIMPKNVFDTQVAAQVCGFGESVGYQALVKDLLKVDLSKEMRFTNWKRRPLSPEQLKYALDDVTYLRDVYVKLKENIEKTNRENWVMEEMQAVTDPATYEIDPMTQFERIRTRTNHPKFLNIVRELAAWREVEAQHRNMPRAQVLKDEAILSIASHKPKTVEELQELRLAGRKSISAKTAGKVLESLNKGLNADPETYPRANNDRAHRPTQRQQALMDLLKILLRAKCAEHDVAPSLVCNSDDLFKLVSAPDTEQPCTTGWRREVFGQDALDLITGKIALTANARGIKILPLPASV